MFKKMISKLTTLFISGSTTFYMRVFLLTLVLIATLAIVLVTAIVTCICYFFHSKSSRGESRDLGR